MTLKYASIDNITKRLEGRLHIINSTSLNVSGITGTAIGTDLILIVGEEVEDTIDKYLGMIYEMPLKSNQPYINHIVDKLICADIYDTYTINASDGNAGNDSFSSILKTTSLNKLQALFNGLGIYIPGSDPTIWNIQNDETKTQMVNKPLILPGETLKRFIGYDLDGDGIADTDLFKFNANIDPSFYVEGELEAEDTDIRDGIRVRDYKWKRNGSEADISFW